MVVIGAGAQTRLLDVAKRQLGPGGDAIIRDAAQQGVGVPLDQVSFSQIPTLLAVIERDPPAKVGQATAFALADGLEQLRRDVEAGLRGRLVGLVSKRLGPAAEPFLNNVCNRLGISLDTIDRSNLPQLALMVRQDATALLGAAIAESLEAVVLDAASTKPAGLHRQIVDVAKQHLGFEGEAVLRRFARERLETEIDGIDSDGLMLLRGAVQRDGPAWIGKLQVAAFVAAARVAMASPAEPLRAKIVDLTKKKIGPMAPEFLKRVCAQHGLPFEAVDYEHLMWLTEVVRSEAAPLAGKKDADNLARDIRGLLTGMK